MCTDSLDVGTASWWVQFVRLALAILQSPYSLSSVQMKHHSGGLILSKTFEFATMAHVAFSGLATVGESLLREKSTRNSVRQWSPSLYLSRWSAHRSPLLGSYPPWPQLPSMLFRFTSTLQASTKRRMARTSVSTARGCYETTFE